MIRCKDLDFVCGLPRGTAYRMLRKAHNAIARCTDEFHERYYDYGGRGISIHPPWIEDIRLFVLHLISLPGCDDPRLFLDRADNDGDYVPGNLRFVTPSESILNQRGRIHVDRDCSRIHR